MLVSLSLPADTPSMDRVSVVSDSVHYATERMPAAPQPFLLLTCLRIWPQCLERTRKPSYLLLPPPPPQSSFFLLLNITHARMKGQHQVQNSNPEVLKDYLSRLDNFGKRDESSKVSTLQRSHCRCLLTVPPLHSWMCYTI